MTWEEARDALRSHFFTRWTALGGGVPLHGPNTKPLTGVSSESGAAVRLTFQPAFGQRVAIGGPLRIQGGQAIVEVYTSLASGDNRSLSLCRTVESIWESAKANSLSGDIILGDMEPLGEGRDPDIPAWRSGVAIAFTIAHSPS